MSQENVDKGMGRSTNMRAAEQEKVTGGEKKLGIGEQKAKGRSFYLGIILPICPSNLFVISTHRAQS